MNPDNARILRITAAAGTELADSYSQTTIGQDRNPAFFRLQKQFTTHRAVFLHAAWLGQTSIHCPIFLTAASRRSLVPVSVPMWGIILSDPLPIVDLVSRYLTNYLMGRMPVLYRITSFHQPRMPSLDLIGYYFEFLRDIPVYRVGCIRVTHPCAGRRHSIATARCPSACMC